MYLITDDRRSKNRPVEEIVSEALEGGIKMIQYRPDRIKDEQFLEKARLLRKMTAEYGCKLIINDRVDIALLSDADGVHIGKGDLPVGDIRSLLGADKLIGYSAHDADEAEEVQASGVDFMTYSPIFPTTSSSKPRDVVGVEKLVEILDKFRITIPVYPLGGIGLNQITALKKSGINRAAVVTAITEQGDIKSAVEILTAAQK
ncbi:MAG TPA: thiamine phosphate synthase [bacterium]|nr:thiamine phosphate synthase [bacterium]